MGSGLVREGACAATSSLTAVAMLRGPQFTPQGEGAGGGVGGEGVGEGEGGLGVGVGDGVTPEQSVSLLHLLTPSLLQIPPLPPVG